MPAKKVSAAIPGAAIVLAVVLVLYLNGLREADYVPRAVASLVIALLCLFAVVRRWGGLVLRGPLVYLTLLILFHLGLVWTLGAFGAVAVLDVTASAGEWITGPYVQPAVVLSCLAIIVFSVVCVVLAPKDVAGTTTHPINLGDHQRSERVAALGIAVELLGLPVLFLAVLRAGGFRALSGGYMTFLENAQSSGVAYGIWAIGLGACLSQLGRRSVRHGGLLVFAAFAAVMFPLGLRGSVLFPAVVLLTTRAMIGRHIRPAVLAAGSVVILVVAAAVRQTRIGGNASGEPWYREAMSTVTELGFSLRPTVEVLRWDGAGQPHSWFVSFVAVPIRLVERITGWHGGNPVIDERLFNVKVNQLAGPIGGSPVAEGYDAAGWIGVVVLMALIAVAICWVGRIQSERPRRLAMFPVVFLPLVIAVRNSFAPVLPQIVVASVLVWLAARTNPHEPAITPVRQRTSSGLDGGPATRAGGERARRCGAVEG